MKRMFKVLIAIAALAAMPFVWLSRGEYRPADVEPVEVRCDATPGALEPGVPFKVLSWNIQFAGSREHQFFYDGGDVVHVPEADVERTLDGLTRALRDQRADIVMLQEVDRDSARTHRRDQLEVLLAGVRTPCHAAAPYFRSRFVPAPTGDFLGRIDMSLALITRFALREARRTQLPLLDEPRWRQAFNLKRALLTAEIPIEGMDQPLAVAVTHLSAFSKGDGTLEKQTRVLEDWMAGRPRGQPWILAGDLNMLPPGDDPARLTADEHYSDAKNPMERLIPRFTEVMGAEGQLAAAARTYLPFGAEAPDRKIDYLFVGGPIEVMRAQALRQYDQLSDHLPLQATLRIREDGEATEPKVRGEVDTGFKPERGLDGRILMPGQLQPDSGDPDTDEP